MFKPRMTLTPSQSAWVVRMTPVTLMFALMLIKDVWIFARGLRKIEKDTERE